MTGLPLTTQIAVLAAIGIGITLAVYGFVGLIVKADDLGIWLARTGRTAAGQRFGRFIVKVMPNILIFFSWIGTAAMLWVGAGIIVHGIPAAGNWLHLIQEAFEGNPTVALVAEFFAFMIAGLIFGFLVAVVVTPVLSLVQNRDESGAH